MRPQLQIDMADEALQQAIQAQHLAQQKELYKKQFTKELYRYSAAGLICPLFCMAWYWLNQPEGGIVWGFLLLGSAVIVAYTLYWLTRHRRAWVKMVDQEMYRAMISTTARLSILLMLAGGLAAVLTVNEFGAAAARACLLSAVLVFVSTTLPAVWDRRRAAWLFTTPAVLYRQVYGGLPESRETLEAWWLENQRQIPANSRYERGER